MRSVCTGRAVAASPNAAASWGAGRRDRANARQGLRHAWRLYRGEKSRRGRGPVPCSRFHLHHRPSALGSPRRPELRSRTSRPRSASAQQCDAVAVTKAGLQRACLPVLATETHIVPVIGGHTELSKRSSDLLLEERIQFFW